MSSYGRSSDPSSKSLRHVEVGVDADGRLIYRVGATRSEFVASNRRRLLEGFVHDEQLFTLPAAVHHYNDPGPGERDIPSTLAVKVVLDEFVCRVAEVFRDERVPGERDPFEDSLIAFGNDRLEPVPTEREVIDRAIVERDPFETVVRALPTGVHVAVVPAQVRFEDRVLDDDERVELFAADRRVVQIGSFPADRLRENAYSPSTSVETVGQV